MDIYKLLEKYPDPWCNDAPLPDPDPSFKSQWMWEHVPDEKILEMGREYVKNTKYYNNGVISVRRDFHPGDGWVEGRIPYKRKSPTEETREKLRKANTGQVAWNKGKKGVSAETSAKMSKSAKARKRKPNVEFN